MSEKKIDPEFARQFIGWCILLGTIIIGIASGLLVGAWAGWLFFGLLLIAFAIRISLILHGQEKEKSGE